MFATDHLVLREWRTTDVANFQQIWNDRRCLRSLSPYYNVPQDVEKAKELIQIIFRGPGVLIALAITLKPPVLSSVPPCEAMDIASDTRAERKEEEIFLGWITIDSANPKNRDGTLGIALLPGYWNRGYGTEVMLFVVDYAFRGLNLHRVSLEVFEGNNAAKRVYEKIGFKVEGVKKRANWVDGKWRDLIIMAIVEDEYWEAHPLLEDG